MPWTLDGEYQEGEEHIIIENIYNAIELMVPEKKEEPEQENAGGYDFASGPLLP